jgi:LacI family transcriptional regulator
MNERRVTLAAVARAAGVHVTTVSLALRNHPRLPEHTRTRIQRLANALGYAPDPILRALVSYRGRVMERRNPPTLAYVTNWNTRWGWKHVTAHPDFYSGAEEKARELGFRLEHFWLREPGLTSGRMSRILEARGIGGIVLASHVREIDEELQFDWNRFSAVKIDYFPHQPHLPNVTNNQLQVIRLAMQQVLAAGYGRIAFVMDQGWDITVDRLWSAGFLWGQQDVPVRQRLPIYLFPHRLPLAEWLAQHRPEVVISKAEFVHGAFKQLGWQAPRDVAFVDIFLEDFSGRVAGVRQNHREVGALAIEILAGRLQHNVRGVPVVPTTTAVDGTWFDGESCPRKTAEVAIAASAAVR